MKKILLLTFMSLLIAAYSFAQYENVDFEPAGIGASWNWVMDQNGTNPPLTFIANPVSGGGNTTPTVAAFTAELGGQPWALTYTDDMDEFMFDATNSTVSIWVYKTVLSDVAIKFEGSSAPIEIKIANTTTNVWEQITYDFSGSIGNTYSRIVIIPDFDLAGRTQDNLIYFDNLQIPEGNVIPPAVPMVDAPTPTHDPVTDNVLSVYSAAYTDLTNTDFNPNWGQSTVQTFEVIVADETNKYANLTYQGTQLDVAQDLTGHGFIHIDFWTPNAASLQFFLISLTTGERLVNLPITTEQWVSVDIPLSDFSDQGLSIADIHQFKIVGNGNVWFDNWYFHGIPAPPADPGMAAPVPTHDETNNEVLSIFSESYTNLAGVNYNPNWGQSTVVTFPEYSGNFTMKYAGLNYQGTDWAASPQDVSNKEFLHVDFWTSNSTQLEFFLISPGPVETAVVLPIVPDQWNSIDIPLGQFAPVDLTSAIQFKVVGNGTVWFDNLYFYTSSALPVQLVDFGAKAKRSQIELSWETASEVNSNYFQVEKSTNLRDFTTVDVVAAAGNTNFTQVYSTLDNQPVMGVNYYRLKQVDYDGKVAYSDIVSVDFSTDRFNLVSKLIDGDDVRLDFNIVNEGNYTLSIFDVNGRLVSNQDVNLGLGVNTINTEITQSGIFFARMSNAQEQIVEKIFK